MVAAETRAVESAAAGNSDSNARTQLQYLPICCTSNPR